ncbi:MAG: hypothetical protein Q8O67_22785 [Deltaproteobacteria bacterium]|nr:hypothetical protein [Deltaproteobacteria bacterium]
MNRTATRSRTTTTTTTTTTTPDSPHAEAAPNDDADDDGPINASADVADGVLPPLEVSSAAPAPSFDIAGLFAQLDVRPSADGGITITAPAGAAAALAALLSGVARMLTAGAPPTTPA